MFDKAMALNKNNILFLLEKNKYAKLLDLGCDDGAWTLQLAKKICTKEIYGIDIVEDRLKKAKENGVNCKVGDLNNNFPYCNDFFDVVHANQVIEHISNLDIFVSEMYRVTKQGGYIVISTENASSWHNIFASIMGWQIFSLTNISSLRLGIGNPLAVHRNSVIDLNAWTHKTIFNYRGIKEFLEIHNFKDIIIKGTGYYPFPEYFAKIDVRHSHFLTLKCFKR